MAKLSLRKLMNLSYISEPSVDDIIAGLNTVKTVKAVSDNANLSAAIDACLISLETYKTIRDLYEKIVALTPLIEKATKIGAATLNPAMWPEIINDTVIEVTNLAKNTADEIPKLVIDAVLDAEVEV
jgi:hypothetical protein